MKSKWKRIVSVLLILLLCMASILENGFLAYASEEPAQEEIKEKIEEETEQETVEETEQGVEEKQEGTLEEEIAVINPETPIDQPPQHIQELLQEAEKPKAATCISEDRATGIEQIQSIIPDYNFAAAVYDSLFAADYLGTEGQSVKEVLASYTGDIDANGHAKRIEYTVTAVKMNKQTYEPEEISQTFDSQEEAQAFLDSLVNTTEFIYVSKKLASNVIEENFQKPDDQLIADITGIEWLRIAKKIDINYNKITSVMQLSLKHLASLTPDVGSIDTSSGGRWFGEPCRNLRIDFLENPIQTYPSEMGGRIIRANNSYHTFPVPQNITIKSEDSGWSHSLDIVIPEITFDGERITVWKDEGMTIISDALTDIFSAQLNRDRLTNEIAPITGITHSGTVRVVIGWKNRLSTVIATEDKQDIIVQGDWITGHLAFNQSCRVYIKTKTEPSTNEPTIKIKKTIDGTDKPVAGAAYKLYHAAVQDGQYTKGDLYSDAVYTTEADGTITITEELPLGDYCFVESQAPGDFILDETILGFTLTGGIVTLGGGDREVTPTGGDTVTAEENETYIDRYSADITLQVTPHEGNVVRRVNVTYWDHETQAEQTKDFETAQAAQDWINTNKGNTDTVGAIEGLVKIKAVYGREIDLPHTNTRSTADFSFMKVDAADDTAMEGVSFTLTCGHIHDEGCGGLTDPNQCTHGHNDTGGQADEQGCTWETTVASDAAGKVLFPGLLSADYILKEVETLDGFILPAGAWTVTVDATKDADQIQVQKTNAEETDTPAFEIRTNEAGIQTYYLKNAATLPFSFTKVDGSDRKKTLEGVVFDLYECKNTQAGHTHEELATGDTTDCWTLRETVTSDGQGLVKFEDLASGDYQLVETKANAAYELPAGQWRIHANMITKSLEITAVGDRQPPAFEEADANGDVSYRLPNYKKKLLPMAGGKGTTPFTYFGIALLAAAVLVGVTKNKRKKGSACRK